MSARVEAAADSAPQNDCVQQLDGSSGYGIIGLSSDEVRIVKSDAQWPQLFFNEKERILRILGHIPLDIQHVGSTSVPGLPAKPIIDIAIAISSVDLIREVICLLERLDYQHRPEIHIPGEDFFRKLTCGYHVHVLTQDTPQWDDYILFRDYLCAHPDDAQEYVNLKLELAKTFPDNRVAYTVGKAELIQSLLRKARVWRGRGVDGQDEAATSPSHG